MRVPLFPFLVLLLVGIAVDFLIYKAIKRSSLSRKISTAYLVVAILATVGALFVGIWPKKTADDTGLLVLMWTLFAYLSIYIPKYLIAFSLLLRRLLSKLFHRWFRAIPMVGATVGAAIFGCMWWGALVGRFNVDVKEVEITIPGLPKEFDGYRIVQISDFHTGTFGDNPTFPAKVVETVNSLKPDVVLFTGDIVNRHSIELEPFVATLSQLSAPDSVWSVMGNHDYGDYSKWSSNEAKVADIDNLQRMQRSMGWNMLNNSHTWLRRGDDSIALIGVENIGDPPFHCYGNTSKAYENLNDGDIKILMSHNPAHWVDSIADRREMNVALTLSGHTHAMQMEIGGWSPAAWRYPTWGGLYKDSLGRMLYVNIGLGEVGFPARIGANPEVTLIILKK